MCMKEAYMLIHISFLYIWNLYLLKRKSSWLDSSMKLAYPLNSYLSPDIYFTQNVNFFHAKSFSGHSAESSVLSKLWSFSIISLTLLFYQIEP